MTLTRTLWCLDCGQEISDLPQQQRESGALLAICPQCAHKRIERAQEAVRTREAEAIREEERAERTARNYEAMMLRNFAERKKMEEQDKEERDLTLIEEGGVIPWIQ